MSSRAPFAQHMHFTYFTILFSYICCMQWIHFMCVPHILTYSPSLHLMCTSYVHTHLMCVPYDLAYSPSIHLMRPQYAPTHSMCIPYVLTYNPLTHLMCLSYVLTCSPLIHLMCIPYVLIQCIRTMWVQHILICNASTWCGCNICTHIQTIIHLTWVLYVLM
jgi:hypothetical protein